jgi:CO/xanthine dehydrogenase Mo-binding subunit
MAVSEKGRGDHHGCYVKIIGKRQSGRKQRYCNGGIRYLDDIKFPIVYGKVLRSPHAHAIIKRIDKTKALELPGVKAVLSWEDVPDWKAGTPRCTRILDRKVRYVGDAIALVAANTEEIAKEALRLIDVEYEVLPAGFDVEEALNPGAPNCMTNCPGKVGTPDTFLGPKGLTEICHRRCGKRFCGSRRDNRRTLDMIRHQIQTA